MAGTGDREQRQGEGDRAGDGSYRAAGRRDRAALELAGDEVTRAELAAALSRAVGRDLNLEPLSAQTLARLGAQRAAAAAPGTSFAGWQADIPALR